MDGRPEDQGSTPNDGTRGVLLVERGRDIDATLRDAIAAHGWSVTALHDPVMAMAELCLLERSQAARSAWGLRGTSDLVLVLADPTPLDDLVDAVQWYLPGVAIWRAENGTMTMLDAPPETAADTPTSPAGPPAEDAPPADVTAAEIDMLFGSAHPGSTP